MQRTRTVTIATHTESEDVLIWFGSNGPVHPELVDEIPVDTVVPRTLSKEAPFNRNRAHHGLFVTCSHDDTIPICKRLVLRVVDPKSTAQNHHVHLHVHHSMGSNIPAPHSCTSRNPLVSRKNRIELDRKRTWPEVVRFHPQKQLEPIETAIRFFGTQSGMLKHVQSCIEDMVKW